MKEFDEELDLLQFLGKNVTIFADNGETFIGIVEDYFHVDENEDGQESIIVKIEDGGLIEFKQTDIDEISLI